MLPNRVGKGFYRRALATAAGGLFLLSSMPGLAAADTPLPLTLTPGPVSVSGYVFQTASIEVLKTAAAGILDQVGNEIFYTYTITNTGNVTLFAPYTVTDDMITGLNKVTCATTPTTLAPGATVKCTAKYHITQDDLDHGSVTNLATAQVARNPGGDTVSDSTSLTVNLRQEPALRLVKSTTATSYWAGGTITYTYTLTNTGNVTLPGPFTVSDNLINSGQPFACGDTGASMVPGGAGISCTADYLVSQDDVDAGSVTNSAVASAHFGKTPVTSNRDSVTVVGPPPARALHLAISTTATTFSLGDWIDYSYTLTNTGNVTLSDIFLIADEKGFDSNSEFLCGPFDPKIAPGAATTCTLHYRVTPVDTSRGWVTNTAVGVNKYGPNLFVTSNEAAVTVYGAKISTELSATTGLVGDTIFDSATLSDTGTLIAGTVTYTYFDSAQCEGSGHSAGVAPVVGGVVTRPSISIQFNTPGTYYWQAVYRNGANDIIVTSKCADGQLTIDASPPPPSSGSPSLTPSQAVAGETATPANHVTPPPTNTGGSPAGDVIPSFALLICLACGVCGLLGARAQRKSITR